MSLLVFFKKDGEIKFLGTSNEARHVEINGILYLNQEYSVGVSSAEVIENPEILKGELEYFLLEASDSSVIKKNGEIIDSEEDGSLVLRLGGNEGFETYDKISQEEVEELKTLIERIFELVKKYEEEN